MVKPKHKHNKSLDKHTNINNIHNTHNKHNISNMNKKLK